MTANEIIQHLNLSQLPLEGGYYRELYRSADTNDDGLSLYTNIFYLLKTNDFSAFHQLNHDEIYHFLLGDPVELHLIDEMGDLTIVELGKGIFTGQALQYKVKAGIWQGLKLQQGCQFALLGTTMSPGFDIGNFKLGDRKELIEKFPRHSKVITDLTR